MRHAHAAADTAQDAARLRRRERVRASVIDNNDVHLAAFRRAVEKVRVRRELLARPHTRKHVQEELKILRLRNDFLYSDECDVQFRSARREADISFVFNKAERPRVGDAKVGSRHSHIGGNKFLTEPVVRDHRQFFVFSRKRNAKFLRKFTSDLFGAQVRRRGNDVCRTLTEKLNDVFAKVCLQSADSYRLKRLVQRDFL